MEIEVSREEEESCGEGEGADGKAEAILEVADVTGPGEEEAAIPKKKRNAWFHKVETEASCEEEGGSGDGDGADEKAGAILEIADVTGSREEEAMPKKKGEGWFRRRRKDHLRNR